MARVRLCGLDHAGEPYDCIVSNCTTRAGRGTEGSLGTELLAKALKKGPGFPLTCESDQSDVVPRSRGAVDGEVRCNVRAPFPPAVFAPLFHFIQTVSHLHIESPESAKETILSGDFLILVDLRNFSF